MIMMSTCYHLSALLALIVSVSSQQPPHVVFILVDDMGWNDVSFHGSDQIQTPNIDALAYHGVILQQYYSEAICTPARTALLTGKYPMRLGMHGFPLYNSEDRGIPVSERLLPSYLKDLGYSTHLVGKWHVGMSKDEYLPTARGYDSHYGMRGGFVDYYTYNKVESWPDGRQMFGMDLFDGFEPQEKEQRYIVDALTDRAIQIIGRHNASRPLFLQLTHNAPHAGNSGAALQPPLPLRSGVTNRHVANSDRRLYADVVTHLDETIGQVVRALADKNILHETLIIFASDNGAPTIGPLANWGVNLPFRGKKSTPWEGAVRVPALAWHASFRPKVWDGLMHITDWLPTLISAAGGTLNKEIDGVNQWKSILRDEKSRRNEVLLSMDDTYPYASYRAGDYKIILGNVTGMENGFYGAEYMEEKDSPPDYYTTLESCETAKVFESMGLYLDKHDVEQMRSAATVRQEDPVRDQTLCIPTSTMGCLFNVRRDPMEAHNLWHQAKRIATLLANRLQELWSMQLKRGPPALRIEADPKNYHYNWMPWLSDNLSRRINDDYDYNNDNRIADNKINNIFSNRDGRSRNVLNVRAQEKCDGLVGIQQFMCVLRNVF